MIREAKAHKLSVAAAHKYLNETLLRPPLVTQETLDDYRISLPVSERTAWLWMRRCGAVAGKYKQNFYNDYHESELVKRDRQERYIPEQDRDEERQALWAQVTRAEYDALAAATRKAGGVLPAGHTYEDAAGRAMVELHVDDSDALEAYRAARPLGGDFSVPWAGGPSSPPSAPPAELPNPGEDTLQCAVCEPAPAAAPPPAAAAAPAEAEEAEETAPSPAPLAPSPPPPLTKTFITRSNRATLAARCHVLNLSTGTVAHMREQLRAHLSTLEEAARGGATDSAADGAAEAEAAEAEAESYEVSRILDMEVRADGTVWYEVTFAGWEDKEKPSWEPAQNLDSCEDALSTFYFTPDFRQPGCVYGHHRAVCRCHRPLWPVGHDEAIVKANLYSVNEWSVGGVTGMRKKTDGPGMMISGFQCEQRGFGSPLTSDELARVNAYRAKHGRPPLTASPGVRFLQYGANKEGYWNYEKFREQVIDFVDMFEALHPDWQLLLELDWSSGHAHMRKGALNAAAMNVMYGGDQPIPSSTPIPSDPTKAAAYLGPHDAKMQHGGKEIDCKLKPGDTQHFYFRAGDPPPFYDLNAPKVDTVDTAKRNRKGEHPVKEGYIDKPKGSPPPPPLCPCAVPCRVLY